MGEVITFPRKATRPEYPAAELDRVRETVERMMASGYSEDEAYDIAVIRLRMEGGRGD